MKLSSGCTVIVSFSIVIGLPVFTPPVNPSPAASLQKSALAALALVVFLFADVIFRGASLAPLDYGPTLFPDRDPAPPASLYPESADRQITDSWGDIGSAAWQMQPAIRFMAYCFRSGESPWWNPYDAAGRMGPESLYDVPFSPAVLLAALFGGSSTAISFVLLASYFLAAFALIRALNLHLEVSFLAAVTAAAAYLLNGFSLANLNTAIGQPYFFAPLLLLALLPLAKTPTAPRFCFAALVQAVIFTITIFPTMVLSALGAYALALAFCAMSDEPARLRMRNATALCAVPLTAFCMVAFLYLPILEAQFGIAPLQAFYDQRPLSHFHPASALSLFTPKHFWQSYAAINRDPQGALAHREPWLNHIGIVTSLLAGCGAAIYRSRRLTAVSLVCVLLVCAAVGRMFGIPPLTLIDHVPFFVFIRSEYWPALAGLPLAVLAAFGLDRRGKCGEFGFALAGFGLSVAFVYLFAKNGGFPLAYPARTAVFLFLAILLFGIVGITAGMLRFANSPYLRIALSLGLVAEGVYYMNTLRPVRSTRGVELPHTIQFVKSRLNSLNGSRALNIGRSGLFPNWGGAAQIPEVSAIELVIVPQYLRFFADRIGSGLFATVEGSRGSLRFTKDSLSQAGVRFVIVERAAPDAVAYVEQIGLTQVSQDRVRFIYENPAPLPRVYLIPPAGNAAIETYHHTSITLSADNLSDATLVLSDSWHPNWHARVDGKSVPVFPVNIAFRGISLPAGHHKIEFAYRPKSLTPGLWLTALGFLGCLLSVTRKFHLNSF